MVEAWDQSPPFTCADAMHVHAMLVELTSGAGLSGRYCFCDSAQLSFVLCALGYLACAGVVNGAATGALSSSQGGGRRL
jgi:hypothetical protein